MDCRKNVYERRMPFMRLRQAYQSVHHLQVLQSKCVDHVERHMDTFPDEMLIE